MATQYVGDVSFAEDTDASHSVNEFGLDVVDRYYKGATTGLAAFLATVGDGSTDPEGASTGLTVKQRGRKVQGLENAFPRVTVTLCGRMDGSTANTPTLAVDSRVIHTLQIADSSEPPKNVSVSCFEFQTTYTYAVCGERPTEPAYSGPSDTSSSFTFFDVRPLVLTFPLSEMVYVNRCTEFHVEQAGDWFEVTEVWTRSVDVLSADGLQIVNGFLTHV